MKASELIEELNKAISEHGDLEVYIPCDAGFLRGINPVRGIEKIKGGSLFSEESKDVFFIEGEIQ